MVITEKLIYVWIIYLLVPVTAYYFLALISKMPIRQISIGIGKKLFKSGLVNFHLLPISANLELQLIDSEPAMISPLERKPLLFRIAWLLVGSFALALIGITENHSIVVSSFMSGLHQPFTGMLSPFTTAQEYLNRFWSFVENQNALSIAGLIGIKSLALTIVFLPLNILPLIFEKIDNPAHWMLFIQQKLFMFIWLFLRALIFIWFVSVAYFIYTLIG